MQIARQVYGIETAENALIFFSNGDPAYLTRRFDAGEDGSKIGTEDFATLADKTAETDGSDFKYEGSYEDMAGLIDTYLPAAMVEKEKFFGLVLFNYLFSNGDAHLKNFSVVETGQGDHMLCPAYDLVNTGLHVDDTPMALRDGLFEGDYYTESFEAKGFYAYDDCYQFGLRIGLVESRVAKILQQFLSHGEEVQNLTRHSYLDDDIKAAYIEAYRERRKALGYSMAGRI